MRSRLFPLRWFVALVLIGLAAGAVYVISHKPPAEEAEAGSPSPLPITVGKQQVVCLGYVDLSGGVTSLTTAQPARVTELLVAENAHVETGTLLLTTDDRASLAAVNDAKAALRAADDNLDSARRMAKRHEIQVQKQEASIRAARARLAAAKRGLEAKQSLQPVHEARILAARARLQAAKRGLELKQNLQSVRQASEKEVAVAEEQVRECDAGLQVERASSVDEKEVAVAAEDVKQWEAGLEMELARRAELGLADPQQQVRQAEASVERAEAGLAQAQALAAGQQVRAPAAGSVLRVLTRRGEIVSGASPAMLFAADGPRIVRSEVEQQEVDRVKVGAVVVIKDDVIHGGVWHGKVLQLASWYSKRRTIMEDTSTLTDVPTVELLASIEDSGRPPRIGQRVRVFIESAEPKP